MANPKRNASGDRILSPSRTFFVTTKTSMGKALLQSDRNATLLIDVLRFYGKQGKFQLHDFVVMPNHLHLLITVSGDSTVERVMQFIKGGFSYRLKRELGYLGEVWQRGFSEVRVDNRESYVCHQEYIAQNPLGKDWWTRRKSFLTASPIWQNESEQGLKPNHSYACAARLKPCPDTGHRGGDSRKPRVSSGTIVSEM
jgi:putative transposase